MDAQAALSALSSSATHRQAQIGPHAEGLRCRERGSAAIPDCAARRSMTLDLPIQSAHCRLGVVPGCTERMISRAAIGCFRLPCFRSQWTIIRIFPLS